MASSDTRSGKQARAAGKGNAGDPSGRQRRSGQQAAGKPGSGGLGLDGDVGNVLRSAYQQTVEEAIPPEMLDLLSKLD
ncbi:NepR family anti-sigma factor [Sphingobium aquiterrae]|uniref:NepR family anti-sigma factor n=1 Tax=Sphingobium aquiterrae TaxID=2038656 RepID=UPI0030158FB7